ncbi:helicase [Scytonema sp. UIC 10036]|uniref:helicase-related protein n=1 Tax=Scytonema sp. UIC 10036 TaxID=2304196 RepID=UPI0012DA6766|nr:helicase-related protein [Scytonema sp. UIC 10036]MUG99374.1 helicase [Scytonema sp. UIC 10036]
MTFNIAEELGRLFEVGFNIGILAYIKEKQIKHNFGNLYLQELQQLKFPKMLKQILSKIVGSLEREIVEKWSIFFLQKGFFCGLNFFGEYIRAIDWDKPNKLRNLEILYHQCKFSGDNSIGTYENKNTEQWFKEVLRQFDALKEEDMDRCIEQYVWKELNLGKKGEFINADTLILLRNRKQVKILCVDLSVFSIRTEEEVKNLDYVEIIRRLLLGDINYLRSKSVFSQLNIDTESLELDFSEDLKSYFTAFKYKDKESSKLIQAAGYLHSFYKFLKENNILPEEASVVLHAVGYSDRGLSTMSVRPDNLAILKNCYEIYKNDVSGKEISTARLQVFNQIKRSAYKSFTDGKNFVDRLLEIQPNQTNIITHQEQINGFFNSVGKVPDELVNQLGLSESLNLRKAHAELITKALGSNVTYLFLTGNPGIGKTTAIVNFLKKHINDGFLFFYVSPRTQVNLDIIEKFKDQNSQKLCDDRIFALNTHNTIISNNSGEYTVQYLWNRQQGDFSSQSVNFRDRRNPNLRGKRSNKIKRQTEDSLQDMEQKGRGVLNSMCEAVSIIIESGRSNNIVATVAIQSLKKTYTDDTLKHFEKIFRSAVNKKENKVIPERMKNISRKIKHLFIMIDEITGDDSGVEFLDGIGKILTNYNLMLPEYGFNTKVIVADASIVDENIINQHLADKSPEPNKIYFRKASDEFQPLMLKQFKFKHLPATLINANSYPARSLSITYKVVVESSQFNEELRLQQKQNFIKSLQFEIFRDIKILLNNPDVEQAIVYIQDKQRLAQLIDRIKEQQEDFQLFQDYLEIHANIPEEEKEQINKYKNDVKIIFMTASGSRGLSFPKAKHILVEIPSFQIEKNLMEVIQVIYRGRGDDEIDNQDKELIFYLAERSVYYQDELQNQQLSIQESVLNLLNILLILKASIMTRIFGSGKIGRSHFIIIPIGGKSVFAVGATFSEQMANLISELKQVHRRNPSDILVESVYTQLQQLFSQAEFVLRDTTESNYLDLRKSFNNQFSQICSSLDKLLDFGKIELGYISGSLLVVPIPENVLEETYQMSMLDIANYANEDLWRKMQYISYSKSYPESLRSAIKDAIELANKLRDGVDRTQKFEQSSKCLDRYYAFPLFAFMSGKAMSEYFSSNPEEPKNESFREILATYIRTLYSVGNIFPIGHNYQDFPFVVFRSYSLEEMRQKIFTDKYLLSSNELNVINLILSKETV